MIERKPVEDRPACPESQPSSLSFKIIIPAPRDDLLCAREVLCLYYLIQSQNTSLWWVQLSSPFQRTEN